VFDAEGNQLVQNIPDQTLQIVPKDIPHGERLIEVLNALSPILNEPSQSLNQEVESLRSSSYQSLLFRDHLPYDTAMKLRLIERELPGFHVVIVNTRKYLFHDLFAHLLGYTGKISNEEKQEKLAQGYELTEQTGKTGIEFAYEKMLRGTNGREQVEVDATGKEKRVLASSQPTSGSSITLSLRSDIQRVAHDALQSMVKNIGSTGASLIALDPRNGEVISMVSSPSYDPNIFTSDQNTQSIESYIHDDRRPLFPRAISGQYPSGSTIKPFIAVTALTEHVISPSTIIQSTGGIRIGKWFFPDWQAGGHGPTDVRKAIAQSVNTFFYTIAGGDDTFTGLGIDRLVAGLKRFGFGQTTNIDLPGESMGLLPTPEWKEQIKKDRWYIGDTYHLAIGQGDVLVTPLQMAVATAVVANGGTLYQPHCVKSVQRDDGSRESIEPIVRTETLGSAPSMRVVREGMRDAVLSGSARGLGSLPVAAAGKTGTAQFGNEGKTHAWFTAFAPYDNPEIVVTVVVEGGGEGHTTALPVAREVLVRYFSTTSP
jgi:penicillin-binding protein 2